jgi:hypothetical protein
MLLSKCGPTTLMQHAAQVWALPFSLATTQGIIIIFFSSSYLDVSVQRVDFPIARDNTPSVCWVVPFGNLRIYRLCAAPRSLSQLTTSFIVSQSQGIHHTPLSALKELLLLLIYLFTTYYPNMSKNFRYSQHQIPVGI